MNEKEIQKLCRKCHRILEVEKKYGRKKNV